MRPSLVATCGAIAMLVTAGCGNKMGPTPIPTPSASPTATPIPTPSPKPLTVNVRVQGSTRDLDNQEPVTNGLISLQGVRLNGESEMGLPTNPAETMTDGDGRFTLDLTLPSNFYSVRLQLTRPGYEDSYKDFRLVPGEPVVVSGTPTRRIRPGELAELLITFGSALCGGGRIQTCRRVIVESPSGADVELEIIDYDSEWHTGIFRSPAEPEVLGQGYTTRLTVPPGPVWIVAFGKVNLVAR